MSDYYEEYYRCPIDRKPCPPSDNPTLPDQWKYTCNCSYDCKTGTYYWVQCRRHPEKADAFKRKEEKRARELVAAYKARLKEYEDMFAAVLSIRGTIPEDEFEKKLAAVRLEVANKIDGLDEGNSDAWKLVG